MSGKIEEFVKNLFVMYNDYAACAAAKCVRHPECSATTFTVDLEV